MLPSGLVAIIWMRRRNDSRTAIVVAGITPSLDPASRVSGNPERLAANAGMSFHGSYVLGMGFTMEPERANELIRYDPRNADVLFPYLNGQDLNSRPDCSASRWVINFHDWPEDKARTYPDLYSQVLRRVKPEREQEQSTDASANFGGGLRGPRPELYAAITGLDEVIVIALVSKIVMPVMVPTGQVFSAHAGRLRNR